MKFESSKKCLRYSVYIQNLACKTYGVHHEASAHHEFLLAQKRRLDRQKKNEKVKTGFEPFGTGVMEPEILVSRQEGRHFRIRLQVRGPGS